MTFYQTNCFEHLGLFSYCLVIISFSLFFQGPYRCETCDKVFQKWNQLQRHIKTHDDDKPFRCTQCNDSFNVEDNLKLHMATHPQNDNRQPTCPECGKTFTRTASLKAHIILHVKEENLMCTECGDEFSLQVNIIL